MLPPFTILGVTFRGFYHKGILLFGVYGLWLTVSWPRHSESSLPLPSAWRPRKLFRSSLAAQCGLVCQGFLTDLRAHGSGAYWALGISGFAVCVFVRLCVCLRVCLFACLIACLLVHEPFKPQTLTYASQLCRPRPNETDLPSGFYTIGSSHKAPLSLSGNLFLSRHALEEIHVRAQSRKERVRNPSKRFPTLAEQRPGSSESSS